MGETHLFYRFYGSDPCSALEGSTEEQNYTPHLPDGSVVTELVGSKIQPNMLDPLQMISSKDEFPYLLPTYIFTQCALFFFTKMSWLLTAVGFLQISLCQHNGSQRKWLLPSPFSPSYYPRSNKRNYM